MLPKPKRPSPNHIPALPPERLENAISQLQSLPAIDPVTKEQIEQMLRAAANPESQSLDAIIPTLEQERQDNISETVKTLTRLETGVLRRARQGLQSLTDEEWNALVDAANDETS
jgi:CHASE3 domain sensor protein